MNINNGSLLILLGSLCFSTTGTFQAFAPTGATPFTVTEARMLLGAVTLFLFCFFTKKLPQTWKNLHWKSISAMAVCLLLYQWLFFSAVLKTGVAIGTIVTVGSTPIWTAIVEKIFFGKNPSLRWYIATLLALTGIIALNYNHFSIAQRFDFYLCLPLLAGLTYAGEIIFSKNATEGVMPETSMMLVMAIVALLNLPSIFLFDISWIFTIDGLIVSSGLGIVSAALAFCLFFSGVRTTSATTASTLGMAEPLGAAILGIVVLKESNDWLVLTGIVLIMLSILVLIKPFGKSNSSI